MKEIFLIFLVLLLLIIVYLYISSNKKINQEYVEDKIPLYIFLTEKCKYCIYFDSNKYEKLKEDIGNKFNIKKIYLNDNTKNLFIKYGINLVPTAVIEKNGKFYKIENEITKENILEVYNNSYKKEILIFLSKKCPYCIEYLEKNHEKNKNELSNDYIIKLIFSDEDKNNLFKKYKINYVPKGIILSNNNEYHIKGEINSENIRNTERLNNENTRNTERLNNENTRNTIEKNKKKILVFLSRTCPYCIKYEKEIHNKLLEKLKDEYEFEKIYDEIKENEDKFIKYNIKVIPKLVILDKDQVKEVKGEINCENIKKADNKIEHMENLFNHNLQDTEYENVKTNDDDKKEKELIYKKFEEENIINEEEKGINEEENIINEEENGINKINEEENKNKIIVFLSKTCPYCINYLSNMNNKIENEFGNNFDIINLFIDEDNQNLFKKYNIEHVPQVIVLYQNEIEKVDGNINIININKTINNIKNRNIYMKMIENTDNYISDDEINYKKIGKESFSNILENQNKLLIFLSKTCPYCVIYEKNKHDKLERELKDKCKIIKIYSDADHDNLFEKYDVRFVPKGILLSEDRYLPVEGNNINSEFISKYL
jgi:thiol-disulfide isomerase/thioredoxin